MTSTFSRTRLLLALLLLPGLGGCAGLIVAGGAAAVSAAHDRRTLGSQIDDQAIETKSYSAFKADAELSQAIHVNVTSFNGVALLTGEAPTAELRDKALAAVRGVAGVRRVVNDIRIAPPSPVSARTSDSWITSKVRTKLIGTKQLDSLQIKVVTENSVVYLMGLLTETEADLAINAVSGVSGVARIVKLFEYVDDSRVQNRS